MVAKLLAVLAPSMKEFSYGKLMKSTENAHKDGVDRDGHICVEKQT